MVRYLADAIAWGIRWIAGDGREAALSHAELEHAHWDPVARRWVGHSDGAGRRAA